MRLAFVLALAACGGTQPPPPSNVSDPPGVVQDTRTEIEKRRDAACDKLEPRLFECALADARTARSNGEISQAELDAVLKPDMRELHRQDWDKQCKQREINSYQVRVLEVCDREEQECSPLHACLQNLQRKPGK